MIREELDSIDNITDYGFQEEIISKAAVPTEWSDTHDYGPLTVEERSKESGEVLYQLEFEGYKDIDIAFRLSHTHYPSIHFVEALSQGHSFDVWRDIFGETYSRSQMEEKDVSNLVEDGKLPEEYARPLNNFLHDLVWKE